MSQQTELLIPAFGSPADDDWERAEVDALSHYRQRIESYPGAPISGTVSLRNLGKGADWYVIAVAIGGLFFVIPELHKRIRESLEEYKLIWKELKNLSGWLSGSAPILHPDHYLFLAALFHVSEQASAESLIFLGSIPLPEEHPDLQELPPLLFAFLSESTVIQAAVARDSTVLWSSRLELPSLGSNNSSNPTPILGAT